MSQWVIEIDTPEDEAQLMQILPRYNSRLVEKIRKTESEPVAIRKEKLRSILEKLQASGVAEKFGDPSEWQRETRQDQPLHGRGE
ncbi:hypothetical protein [Spirosoma rhododendri]|uniref:Uncharacterized protein n=1 Tax=Spirosoma rhododendri TaxID=2728024 RepID=A0A7L5DP49_9BACT|nr:hypothetical protein [Spirosoma rhododendri]QJD79342.1 hypothetical protein HH216_13655 [Spirosoma rhododendri]